jgi:hypothetical protein
MNIKRLVAISAIAFAMLGGASAAAAQGSPGQHDLAAARAATAKFHTLATANHAGYGLLTDAAGIACIEEPGMGAMGIHYANSALVGDPSIDAATPEAVVYEPGKDGKLRLVALEYVVIADAWNATHAAPPTLFGQTFNFTPSPNRFGLPPYYSLHAWVWKHNPAGMFEMWNPSVVCPAA